MKKVHILTDSNSHIPAALRQELDIVIVPVTLVWDTTTYLDEIEIGPREFYSRLRKSASIPTTSSPPPGTFKDKIEPLIADGSELLAILTGNEFSSLLKTAKLAAEMIPNGSISILDSESASMGLGFQVLAAARAARDGKTMKEIIADVERVKANSGVVFGVPDVKYLLKGGRINHLQRFVAASLKLVPIMELKDSVIKPLGRVINQRKVIPFLIHLVEERINDARPLRISVLHSDAESDAWKLAKEVRQHLQPDELITSEISPCMGSHVGPEALALAYAAGV